MAKKATATLVPEDQQVFDYGDMEAADSTVLERHATAIQETQDQVRRISADGVIRIGKELKEAQQRLAHHGDGMFNKWVKQRCGISLSCAYKSINAHEVFGEVCVNFTQTFDASALYLLSADSCPEEATEEALRLAEEGQHVSHKVAKELKERFGENEEEETEEEEEGNDNESADDDLQTLFGNCSAAIKTLRTSVNVLVKSSWGYEVEAPKIRRALRDIQTALKEALLTEQCPYCKARGCTACNDTGIVTGRVREQAKECTNEA